MCHLRPQIDSVITGCDIFVYALLYGDRVETVCKMSCVWVVWDLLRVACPSCCRVTLCVKEFLENVRVSGRYFSPRHICLLWNSLFRFIHSLENKCSDNDIIASPDFSWHALVTDTIIPTFDSSMPFATRIIIVLRPDCFKSFNVVLVYLWRN